MASQAFFESYLAPLSLSENREGKMAKQGSRETDLKIEAVSAPSPECPTVQSQIEKGRNTDSITDRARTAERLVADGEILIESAEEQVDVHQKR
jgi:hypothetical protein